MGREEMDVYDCIRTRRTVREFKPDPVPGEIVHKILPAGRWAPSSSNTQPWHFVVIKNRDTIAAMGKIVAQGPFIGQAPLAMAIVMENARRPQFMRAGPSNKWNSWRRQRAWGHVLSG
jgi:nitroreductase